MQSFWPEELEDNSGQKQVLECEDEVQKGESQKVGSPSIYKCLNDPSTIVGQIELKTKELK